MQFRISLLDRPILDLAHFSAGVVWIIYWIDKKYIWDLWCTHQLGTSICL